MYGIGIEWKDISANKLQPKMIEWTIVKKYRLGTTISMKHYALLKKHMGKNDTQQKVLERALESLEGISQQVPALSRENEVLIKLMNEKVGCAILKTSLKVMMDAITFEETFGDNKENTMEYILALIYQKPVAEMSLQEIMEGLIFVARGSNWVDSINYTDDGDYYTLREVHNLGMNGSKIIQQSLENLFTACGVKYQTTISENCIFQKIYKKT